MRGKIIRGVGGFYYVVADDERIYECKARGKFRKDGIKPLVGDDVEMSVIDEEKLAGNIDDIFDRRSLLIRPAVANVDQAMVIFALDKPAPNLGLLDRFLISMEYNSVETVICFSKSDLVDEATVENLRNIYSKCSKDILIISNNDKSGIDSVNATLKGKTTVLAGPSGVGKSSLVGHIVPDVDPEVGSISPKTERGRHTTRHTELFFVEKDTFILDTPGFSSIELPDMLPEEIRQYIPEFEPYEGRCRFLGCTHIHEPDCEVRSSFETDSPVIDENRYKSYIQMFEEANQRAVRAGRSSR
ncbi:MAG: ribosome small subunit-dependent GTPase A [Eubacterium sp.]|nr:ribosome small subunit-dependent GTPase A [Eubacterium sp.]